MRVTVTFLAFLCVLINTTTGQLFSNHETTKLKVPLESYANCSNASENRICVSFKSCAYEGDLCAPGSVCCTLENLLSIPPINESEDVSVDGPPTESRSASAAESRHESLSASPRITNPGGSRHYNPRFNSLHHGYGQAFQHSGYAHGFDNLNGSPYGYAPSPYASHGPVYPSVPNVHGFNHVYGGELGFLAPDFYGPQHLHKLTEHTKAILYGHEYKEQCGVRNQLLFGDYPYYEFGPSHPYESGTGFNRHHKSSDFGQHPWQAAVLGWSEYGYGFRCSAVVIHPLLVVSSAHCLQDIIESELKVVLGVSDLLSVDPYLPSLERAVERIYIHESNDAYTVAHDVALLQLSSPVDFHATPHIAPACLPTSNTTFSVSSCRVVGWEDSYHGPVAVGNKLGSSGLKFIRNKRDCLKNGTNESIYQYARSLKPTKMTEEMHCITGNSSTSCLVPSGVMYCEYGPSSDDCKTGDCKQTFLAGLVAWSNSKCGKEGVAVVTEISAYVKWIDEIKKSVDYYFHQQVYGDLGYGSQSLPYVPGSYDSHGRYTLGLHSALSPYDGDHYGGEISRYDGPSRYERTKLAHYTRPLYPYGKSPLHYGRADAPYYGSSYNLYGARRGISPSPYGGSLPPYHGRPYFPHKSYRYGRGHFIGRPSY